MLSDAFVAFVIALGGGAWVYSRLMHQSGNNTKNSLIGAAISGGIIFLVILTVAGMVFKN